MFLNVCALQMLSSSGAGGLEIAHLVTGNMFDFLQMIYVKKIHTLIISKNRIFERD